MRAVLYILGGLATIFVVALLAFMVYILNAPLDPQR
jgi:hypothetical protein